MVDQRRLEDGLFRTLIENSSDVVLILDAEALMRYASPSAQRHFGYPPEELVGRVAWELIHPEDVAAVQAVFRERLRDPNLFQPTRYRVRHRDGSWLCVEAVASNHLNDPAVEGVVLNVRDVTQRVVAEEALRESERRYRSIFEGMQEGLFVLERDAEEDVFRYVEVNGALERITGIDADHFVGCTPQDVFLPDTAARVTELYERVFTRGESEAAEYTNVLPRGTVTTRTRVIPIANPQGRVVRLVGISEDVTARRAAEEANRRLAAIVAASDDAIISRTLEGTILSWNTGAERIFGYSAEEMLGQATSLLVPPEQEREAADLMRRLQRGEHITGLETTRLRRDGQRIHVCLTISPIHDDAGRIASLSIIARDIGDRLRAGEDLRASNERYRLAGRATKDVIWDWDLDADTIEWGEAIRTTFGYRLEDVPGDPAWWLERVHPDDRKRLTASLSDFFRGGGEVWFGEYRFLRADGSYANVLDRGHVIRTPDGRAVRMIGSLSDLTTQKESERNLADAHARLRHLLAASPTVLYVLPVIDGYPSEQVTWVSDNAERVLNTPRETFLAPGWWRASVHPADQERIFSTHSERPDEDYRVSEYRVRLGDGDWRWVSDQHRLIRDADGEPVEIIGAWTDVTERREAEEVLLQAKNAAEAASRSKSEFLSSMSHELRTPLNSVIGFTNVLRKNKQGNLREQDLAFLERIHANGLHLLGLINDILDLSKIEAGKAELELAAVSLDSLIQETLDELQGSVRRGVELSKAVPEPLELIETDARKLKQILINLVGNALKFTEAGSVQVGVVVEPRSHRPVCVEVRDTGVGIPSERLDAIFEAFEQAESGTTRRFGGTGLGLAISSSLAQLLGFRIEVESEIGVGSTFRVVFGGPSPKRRLAPARPAGRALLPESSEARGESSGELRNRAVLIVDDDPDSRFVLSEAVAEFGCDVVTASTGEHGLRLAREIRPDLILLDLLMPGLTGWETLRALKNDPELCGIPVVVVSVVAEEQRGTLLGVVDLLNKPHERTELLRILRRNLGGTRRRVLVVDDDEDARLLTASCIQAEGVEIRTAANGLEALNVLRSFTPDAILLDLRMPTMNGLQLLARMRADGSLPCPSIIVVTGADLSREEMAQLTGEVSAVLKKNGDLEAELGQELQAIWRRISPEEGPRAAR
jgi:PAS domain S-box-containing protein